MSIRLIRSPASWYCFNHVFDVEGSANISHKVAKRVMRMQPLNTDLLQNELSYWSMNIIYASIGFPIRYVPLYRPGGQPMTGWDSRYVRSPTGQQYQISSTFR